jgi:hypothetical protein
MDTSYRLSPGGGVHGVPVYEVSLTPMLTVMTFGRGVRVAGVLQLHPETHATTTPQRFTCFWFEPILKTCQPSCVPSSGQLIVMDLPLTAVVD